MNGLQPLPDDLARDVVCLAGLPFDAVTMDEAVARVREAIRTRRRMFVSTPNLNFLVGAQTDSEFRRSVIDSDLSLADGMPLVWLSKLLRAPLPGRVTGSGLFERLQSAPAEGGAGPVRVYFFGGPPGAAEQAAHRVNAQPGGMVCVGHDSPGFGSIESMSDAATIDRINASDADFLVVALGAAKGQAWILHNLARLKPPVVSHLGAVVNFAAGTVRRAPAWMQRSGLEWLWRIREEPALWRRYARDARTLARMLPGMLLPYAAARTFGAMLRGTDGAQRLEVALEPEGDGLRLHLGGRAPGAVPPTLEAALRACLAGSGPVRVDLSALQELGPRLAARLLTLSKALAGQGRTLRVDRASRPATRGLRWNGLSDLTDPTD